MKYFNFNQKNKRAFISIFAIFFSAIVTSVLVGMFSLLVRQIQILNMDATSFQAYYIADSSFECFASNEKKATSTNSLLLPNNYNSFSGCKVLGDTTPTQIPFLDAGRAKSTWNFSVNISDTDYCGVVIVEKDGTAAQSSEIPNVLNIAGQSRKCTDLLNIKVIERGIDFFY